MTPSLFISYSRQEAPFANSLLDELEDRGLKVWLDYHSLIPARPWQEEINRGIAEADAVLLIISKRSMASGNVGGEWREAVRLNKRIILIIFEAVALPLELERCEWVDFRKSFKQGLEELLAQLKSPAEEEYHPPQKGFKAPRAIWVAFVVSMLVSVIALPALWTLYLPYFLIPLPYRILKRDFNFFHVQSALIMLPFVLLLTFGILDQNSSETVAGLLFVCLAISVLFAPWLIFLLRSRGLQRWGKPVASRPVFANLYDPNVERPRPVSFAIDAAPEDKRYADDIARRLTKYQHTQVADSQDAEVTFVLVSRYKKETACNPEERIVYPVIIQSAKDIERKLQRIQWIDFRRGLSRLDEMAKLLPEPARLFKALGITPMGDQTVLPRVIQALVNYLIICGAFTASGWVILLLQLWSELSRGQIVFIAIQLGFILSAMFFTARALIGRAGRLASLRNFILIILLLSLLAFFQFLTFGDVASNLKNENDARGVAAVFGVLSYLVGLIIMAPLSIWYWKDLKRWFPQKNRQKISPAAQP
ncbi:MAG: toll/interleukin-1 receptor domain-containing protein [Blastocatellia bacterium]